MKRFFTIIKRANSLIFLLVLLAIVGLLTTEFWPRKAPRDIQAVAATADPASADERLEFGNAQLLAGTDTILVPLTAEREGMKLGSGSGYLDDTRNILAVRGDAKSGWIFDKGPRLIAEYDQLAWSLERDKPAPASAVYFELVEADTNGDGTMTPEDTLKVALADTAQLAPQVVLADVARVLAHRLINAQTLVVLFQTGTEVRQARFDLATLQKVSEETIADIAAIP